MTTRKRWTREEREAFTDSERVEENSICIATIDDIASQDWRIEYIYGSPYDYFYRVELKSNVVGIVDTQYNVPTYNDAFVCANLHITNLKYIKSRLDDR